MSQVLQLPLNRVEGDLEVRVAIEDGRVRQAWTVGTMFRGIERMLLERDARDGLVITPRICGICSTSHLLAAARALENLSGADVPDNADLVRNLVLGAETIQSDLRHYFLMAAPDLTHDIFAREPFYAEAVRRYRPLAGQSAVQAVAATRPLLELITLFAGQWPHASFAVPGGITSRPSEVELRQARLILKRFRGWYQNTVIGMSVDRWLQLDSADDLLRELSGQSSASEAAFWLACARRAGLDRLGRSRTGFLAYHGPDGQPGLFLSGGKAEPFDQSKISEQVGHSRYWQGNSNNHPWEVETRPEPGLGEEHYSWCKAPRYGSQPAETGALAEELLYGARFWQSLTDHFGASVLTRELARLTRTARLLDQMESWLNQIRPGDDFYLPCPALETGRGVGLVQAPRGGLGHWVQISGGKIELYQIITPTGWNASPRDDGDTPGPIEQALEGTPVEDAADPVHLGMVVRSFDPCLVCSVHCLEGQGPGQRVRLRSPGG